MSILNKVGVSITICAFGLTLEDLDGVRVSFHVGCLPTKL